MKLTWKVHQPEHGPEVRNLYLGKIKVARVSWSLLPGDATYQVSIYLPGKKDVAPFTSIGLAKVHAETIVCDWLDLALTEG
jgi:hypothetical protein